MSPETNGDEQHAGFTPHQELFLAQRGLFADPRQFEDPAERMAAWCTVANQSRALGRDDMVHTSLVAAVEAADAMEAAEAPADPNDQTNQYMTLARAAHRLGEGPAYVRTILDKAAAKAGIYGHDEEVLDRDQAVAESVRLQLFAVLAHKTGQGPEYMRPLVDRLRAVNVFITGDAVDRDTSDLRLQQLDKIMGLSRQYGLGEEYEHGVFDEARTRWSPSAASSRESLTAKAYELAGVALAAKRYGLDEAYIHDVLDEGRRVARWGADAGAFAELAKVAHLAEQPERDVADIVIEGLHGIGARETDQPETESVRELNQLLRAIYEPGSKLKEILQGQLTTRGMRLIEDATAHPRRRHEMLNMLLRDVHLAPAVMESRGVRRLPLSYVYRPDTRA